MVEVNRHMKINRKMVGCFLIVFLFMALPVSAKNTYGDRILEKENKEPIASSTNIEVSSNGIVKADLKVRVAGGDWKDSSINAQVGQTLEFKITVEISRSYIWFGILVDLPEVNNNPMLKYKIGSASPLPLDVNDEEIKWSWINIDSPWNKETSFKVKIERGGSKTVNLLVGGTYNSNGKIMEDEKSDSVDITVEKGKSKTRIHNLFFNQENSKIGLFLSKIRTIIMKYFGEHKPIIQMLI